jgi:hypothetical protein
MEVESRMVVPCGGGDREYLVSEYKVQFDRRIKFYFSIAK